jgi:hypothetical protein
MSNSTLWFLVSVSFGNPSGFSVVLRVASHEPPSPPEVAAALGQPRKVIYSRRKQAEAKPEQIQPDPIGQNKM